MSTTTQLLQSQGIDLGAPANYTKNQLAAIFNVLSQVNSDAAKVAVAALQGYRDSFRKTGKMARQTEAFKMLPV